MLETHPVSAPPGRSSLLRSILSLLIITVAIPFGCYTLLKAYHASDVTALASRQCCCFGKQREETYG